MYGVILTRFRELKKHGFGHASDPVSQAVLNGDLVMLDFVLGQCGFDVWNSCYYYIPVCQSRWSFQKHD